MNKLKFDRERFDAGEMPTRTRNGWKVLKVVDSGLDIEQPIVAWIDGFIVPESYSRDGACLSSLESGLDLVHEPRMRKVRVATFWADGRVCSVTTDTGSHLFNAYMDLLTREDRLIEVLEIEVPE